MESDDKELRTPSAVSASMFRALGKYGPEISVIGLGGWQAGGGRTWGPNRSDEEVIEALRHGYDCGANWVDTAEVYAKGRSERIIGRAVRGLDDFYVFSKVAPRPDGSGVRAKEVSAAAEGSLRRLGREVIDVFQLHWRDHEVPIEETWIAMAALVDRGLVRWIGLSNVDGEDLMKCQRLRHVDSLQLHGSILYRDALEWSIPLCKHQGTGLICYGPLGFGLMGDIPPRYDDWRSGSYGMEDFFVAENFERFFAPDALPRQRQRVATVTGIARELGITAAQAALAWLIAQPGVTGAIVGSRSAIHIEENIVAGAARLAPWALARLDQAGRN